MANRSAVLTAPVRLAPAPNRPRLTSARPARRNAPNLTVVERPPRHRSQLLYGDLPAQGFTIQWHAFHGPDRLDWSQSFEPESLELCLNLAGQGTVEWGQNGLKFEPLTAGFYAPGKAALRARRAGGLENRFLTVTFSPRFLRAQLGAFDGALHPLVERLVADRQVPAGLGDLRRLTSEQEQLIAQLLQPPVPQAARPLWYQSRLWQLMAEFFFVRRDENEPRGDRQQRLARERTDRVITILRRQLAEPPNLAAIGREVGCSPFHLSRTFSAETGLTIPQYLRKIRMERAAELLRSGKHNVTEAALAVGYNSLSHFSQAFCQTMGCCPGLYPVQALA